MESLYQKIMYSVVLTELGILILDGEKIVKSFEFTNPASDFVALKKGQNDIHEVLQFFQNHEGEVVTNEQAIMNILKKDTVDIHLMSENDLENIQSTKPQLLVKAGFAKNESGALSKLRDFAIQLSSSKVTEISESPDLHIIQGINSLDEVDKMINGLSSRLREWYGLHFPELDNVIDTIMGYSQIVIAGKRSELNETVFKNAGFPESKVEMLSLVREKSRGGDISEENLEIVQGLAKSIIDLHELRKKIEKNIETQMNSIAPNLSVILGTAVAARVLAKAGSLRKLATMPASTIQVIGAEKALFRSLKTGAQPPKHGLLFQHALVHAAPRWQRGKIARAVAAKAAIASRVDFHSAELNKTLLEKLNVRVDEISKKYHEPVERESKPFESRFGGRKSGGFDRRRESGGRKSGGFSRRRESGGREKKRKKFGRRD